MQSPKMPRRRASALKPLDLRFSNGYAAMRKAFDLMIEIHNHNRRQRVNPFNHQDALSQQQGPPELSN